MHDVITTALALAQGNDLAELGVAFVAFVGTLMTALGLLSGFARALAAVLKRTPIKADDAAIPVLHRLADTLDAAVAWVRPLLPQKPGSKR
jgi:hypothetical protein